MNAHLEDIFTFYRPLNVVGSGSDGVALYVRLAVRISGADLGNQCGGISFILRTHIP